MTVTDQQQTTLFDPPPTPPDAPEVQVRHDAPDTSLQAAERVLPKSGSQRMRVLQAIAGRGEDGFTDAELEDHLGLSGNSIRPRRGELVTQGWVTDSGRRREHGHSGPGIVWVLTRSGRAEWDQL